MRSLFEINIVISILWIDDRKKVDFFSIYVFFVFFFSEVILS